MTYSLYLPPPLGSTAQFRPWPPPQSSSIKNGWISWRLLNSFLFYRGGLLAPRPTSNLKDQASVIISPRGRVAQLYPQTPGTHFSRLLRHAWVTVGLFLFPGHHTGIIEDTTDGQSECFGRFNLVDRATSMESRLQNVAVVTTEGD
jgi:hypothetical protein